MRQHVFMVFLVTIVFPVVLSAQQDTIAVPSDIPPSTGNLNTAVTTAIAAKRLSTTVFKLEPSGYYVLNDSIVVPAGDHLTIIAPAPGATQATAPPQILWASTIENTRAAFFFKCYGNLSLKNVWLLCANDLGSQVSSCISFHSDTGDLAPRSCDFDGVILDYFPCPPTAGGTITVACKNFKGHFKNTYWKNNTDVHFRFYGRAVSFPYNSTGWHGDSLVFEHCTFANLGYVLMQEGNEYHSYVKFNHCTFLNVMMFALESGWWQTLAVTNCVFVNMFMMGDIPAWHVYSPPISFNEPNGGTLRIDSVASFGFAVPFTDQDRRILFANSNYYIEKWLRDWMFNNPASVNYRSRGVTDALPVPQPMLSVNTLRFFNATANGRKLFPYMNAANVNDAINPGFILPPSDTVAMKSFTYRKWDNSSDTTWAWKPKNSFTRVWPLEEDLAYTNETVKAAGMGGYPAGDLYRWWPGKYSEWKRQEPAENTTIAQWLEHGTTPVGVEASSTVGVPGGFSLSQNFPNPFNPATRITYSIPHSTYVTLKVYNFLGQEIAWLVDGVRRAGVYESIFDARSCASGVYFYRLTAGNFSETKKCVVVK